jgi:hypothetical protein
MGKLQMALTAIGGWLGYFMGGMDGLMIALLAKAFLFSFFFCASPVFKQPLSGYP